MLDNAYILVTLLTLFLLLIAAKVGGELAKKIRHSAGRRRTTGRRAAGAYVIWRALYLRYTAHRRERRRRDVRGAGRDHAVIPGGAGDAVRQL